MRIAAVSDLHGHLPALDFDFDALLIAGDVGPSQTRAYPHKIGWYQQTFAHWLEDIDKPVIGVAGNHDFIFQNHKLDLPWTYLQDSGCMLGDFKVWGSPWQPEFGGWAFNACHSERKRRWDMIPDDTDILLLHGPPYGYGDLAWGGEHVGCQHLTRTIERIQPQLVVYGHTHEGYGRYHLGNSLLINAAFVDEDYRPAHRVQTVELNFVYTRAGGETICKTCGNDYFHHPRAGPVGCGDQKFLHRICDGRYVKL